MTQTLFVWLLLCVIWGSTWLFIKLGLRDLPPITFAGLRFLAAALLLWSYVFARRSRLPRHARDWGFIAWTGSLAFSANYALIFWGEQYITSGLAAVLQAMIPAFGMIFAHVLLPDEPLTRRKAAGVALGIAGVGVIFYDQMNFEGTMAVWGCAALLVSALVVGFCNVVVKARAGHFDPAVLAAGQMSFGLLPLLAAGAAFEINPFTLHWTPTALVSLFYLASVGSAAAFLLYYWLVRNIAVTKTLLISLVIPVVALLIGALTIGERVTWRIAAGCAAILSGIGLVIFQPKAKRTPAIKPASGTSTATPPVSPRRSLD